MRYLIPLLIFLSSCTPSYSSDGLRYASSYTPDPTESETIYLWNDGRMPSRVLYDDSQPYIQSYPVPSGVEAKGAVLVCPGGAFQFLSPAEGESVAMALAEAGYVSFVVYYRVRPYSMDESTLDLARAVRFVRKNADVYGIAEDRIAAVGFSAGGILAGNEALFFDGSITGSSEVTTRERRAEAVDSSYIPDSLDSYSADLNAIGMCYSFYGILSHASDDIESFHNGNIPPTYFCYGSNEIFRSEIEKCATAVAESGTVSEINILQGYQHGFGSRGGWIPDFCRFLDENL